MAKIGIRILCLGMVYGLLLPWVYEILKPHFYLQNYAKFAYPTSITPILWFTTLWQERKRISQVSKSWRWQSALPFVFLSMIFGGLYLLIYPFVKWLTVDMNIHSHVFNLFLVYLCLIGLYGSICLIIMGKEIVLLWRQFIPFAVANISYYGLFFILFPHWQKLSLFTIHTAVPIIKLFDADIKIWISQTNVEVLLIRDFMVAIGEACSGVMVLLLFATLYLYVFLTNIKKLNWWKILCFGVLGMFGAMGINVLRVVLIMLIGRSNPQFAMHLFHDQSTWLMMLCYFLLFTRLTIRWVR